MTKWCKAWPDSCITNSNSDLVTATFAEDTKVEDSIATPKALLDEAFPDLKQDEEPNNESNYESNNESNEDIEKVIRKIRASLKADSSDTRSHKSGNAESVKKQVVHKADNSKYDKHDVMTIVLAILAFVGLLILVSILSRISNLENDIKILFLRKSSV